MLQVTLLIMRCELGLHSDLGRQHDEASLELFEVDDAILVAVQMLDQQLGQVALALFHAGLLDVVYSKPTLLVDVQLVEDSTGLRRQVLLQQVHGPVMRAALAHVVALDEEEGHLLTDGREAALVVVRRHEGAVLQQPLRQSLGDAAGYVDASKWLQEERHGAHLRAVAAGKNLQRALAQRAGPRVGCDDASVLWLLLVQSVDFVVDQLGRAVSKELVDVADSCAGDNPLRRDAVPACKLDLQVLQQLYLQVVGARAAGSELAVRALAGIALVVAL
mmetsp:Transcript_38876/g.108154  ORF Transcript_38876/g.108154 Transcript_38876/m.108154 type:complete len:276 (+) Transcript_38876:596-1423(+)